MMAVDEDALICDFAETYHIYDYRQLPPTRAAVFACGLRDDSRIKLKLNGMKMLPASILTAMILDNTKIIAWQRTKDAEKGRNAPKSIFEQMNGPKPKEIRGFDSPEEFRKWRQSMLKEK